MPYGVYTTEHLGGPRNHVHIFVETSPQTSGQIYHVIGNILVGMTYESRKENHPDNDATYIEGSKKFLERVGDLEQLEVTCRSVPPPGRQLALNGTPLDKTKPLRRCGEVVCRRYGEGVTSMLRGSGSLTLMELRGCALL